MTTNLFFIANVKQLRTGGSFRILLPFFRTSWGVGFLNSAIFNSFHNQVEFDTISEGLWNLGGGGGWAFQPPPPGTLLISCVTSHQYLVILIYCVHVTEMSSPTRILSLRLKRLIC